MSKICKNCNTVNEEKFSYCKNCGAPFESTENTSSTNPFREEENYNFIPNEIDGIPTEEVKTFVGKNNSKIISKFSKMSITGSKISWCWPAALLGIFFGFFGAAFWLFYRKMYKHGFIALSIGFIIHGINTAVTYSANIELLNQLANNFYSMYSSSPNFISFLTIFEEAILGFSEAKGVLISNFLNETASYCAAIIYGVFGMYFYKKHTIKKISAYRAVNHQSDYYNFGIKAIGGTSVGFAVLSVLITAALQNIITFIPLFFHILFV